MKQSEEQHEMWTTKEVARRLGCSVSVAREIIKNEIDHIRIGRDQKTGDIRVAAADFSKWLEGRKKRP